MICDDGCMMENIKKKSPLAKAGIFLSRLKVICFELQNIKVKNIVLSILKTSAVRDSLFDIRCSKCKTT